MSHMPLATSAGGGNCVEGDETREKDARGAPRASFGVGGVGGVGVQSPGVQSPGVQSFAGLTSSLALSGVLSHQQISLLALAHRTLCMPPADTRDFFVSPSVVCILAGLLASAHTHLFLRKP